MNKGNLIKYGIKAVAIAFGFLGLTWIGLACHFAIKGIRDSDLFQLLCMTPMFTMVGTIVVSVAWQSIRHFGPKAIRNVVGLVALSAYSLMGKFLQPFQDATRELRMDLHHSATILIPLLLAVLLYRVLSRKLIQMTDTVHPTGAWS